MRVPTRSSDAASIARTMTFELPLREEAASTSGSTLRDQPGGGGGGPGNPSCADAGECNAATISSATNRPAKVFDSRTGGLLDDHKAGSSSPDRQRRSNGYAVELADRDEPSNLQSRKPFAR